MSSVNDNVSRNAVMIVREITVSINSDPLHIGISPNREFCACCMTFVYNCDDSNVKIHKMAIMYYSLWKVTGSLLAIPCQIQESRIGKRKTVYVRICTLAIYPSLVIDNVTLKSGCTCKYMFKC